MAKNQNNAKGNQLKYKDLLEQSQEEKDSQENQFKVEAAKLQLQSDILATKQSIATTNTNILTLMSNYPLDAKSIVEAQVVKEGYEDGLKRLEALEQELF
jgi:hypothetical protein